MAEEDLGFRLVAQFFDTESKRDNTITVTAQLTRYWRQLTHILSPDGYWFHRNRKKIADYWTTSAFEVRIFAAQRFI